MSFHTPAHKQPSSFFVPADALPLVKASLVAEHAVARFERQTREWWVREIAYAHLEVERDQWLDRRAQEYDYYRGSCDLD